MRALVLALLLVAPLARGVRLIVTPEEPLQRLWIEGRTGALELLDGRGNHNNGRYIVRSEVAA